MDITTNLSLKKPVTTDPVSDLRVAISDNADVIDGLVVPQARIFPTFASVSVPHDGYSHPIACGGEGYDLGTSTPQHDNATNNTRLVCRKAGLYHINAWCTWHVNYVGVRALGVRLNGVGIPSDGGYVAGRYLAYSAMEAVSTTYFNDNARNVLATDYRLEVGDWIDMTVLQRCGGALDLLGGGAGGGSDSQWTALCWHWVSN